MTAVLVADLDLEEGAEMPPPLDLDADEEDVAGRELALPNIDSGNRVPAPSITSSPAEEPRRRRWSGPQTQPIPFPSIRRPARTVGRTPLESQLPWRWIGIAAGAVLALALLAWAIGPGLLSEDRQVELNKVLTTAQEQLTAAQGAQRADDRRKSLQAVLASTERARALAPDDSRVKQIEAQAQSQLAVMDAVSDVSALAPLLKFDGTVTAPVTPQSVVAGGRSLWFIETGRGRLFRMDATSSPTPPEEVYRAGATYGGTPARDPVSIAWDAQGNRLLLLDAGRGLFSISESSKTPVPVPLRGSGELRSAVAISVYLRNLYVLDPAGGEIWRYLPASDGYDSERSGMLGGVDIGTATGLVVNADVFVVDQGRLRRFRGGKETVAMLDGIDQPPKAPVALVEDAQRGLLFLADRGNKRIVVGDREGKFVKQYRHPSLGDLRGLAITADGSRLYVLSGDGITYFDVAPAGPPPAQPSPTPATTPAPTGATGASGATGTTRPATATPAR
jgi:DNA-binding beta-propeller fold protein YncE